MLTFISFRNGFAGMHAGKYTSIMIVAIMIFALTACGKHELAEMTTEVHDDHAVIIWDNKTYVPYCAAARTDCGEQIGIVNNDRNDKIYEYKGFSAEEWIINSYGRNHDSIMLYREIDVSDIPDGLQSEYEWNHKATATFQATVIETGNDSVLVEPADGSAELNSADRFSIPNEENLVLQVGDLIEITYTGGIMESYPAQLEEVGEITVTERAEANTMRDRIPMVRVNGELYYDTGRESTVSGRCGNMDGEITTTVEITEVPAEDNQSNFGSGYGYQYGENDTIEIYMNEKWIVFEQQSR